MAGDEYADIEGAIAKGDVPASVPRSGPDPVISWVSSGRELDSSMVERVSTVTKEIGTSPGDVAVLCLTRRAVSIATSALLRAGVPVMRLEEYDGSPVNAVKVGTIKRAKGLEFKQVLIPDLGRAQTALQPPASDTEHERWDLTRRELYVAMTRARDGLWVGINS